MSIAGVEDIAVGTWLNATFTADTALMAAAPGGVWDGPAAEGTEYPLVRFGLQSAGVVVRGNSTVEIMLNSLWLVRGICAGSSYLPLANIASRIQALIHGVESVPLTDGMINVCVREQAFQQEVLQGGREFRHLGGIYRVYVQA